MMVSVLKIFSRLIGCLAHSLTPVLVQLARNEKARTFFNERRPSFWQAAINSAKQNQLALTRIPRATYWVHVASAGELEQAIPILRTLHEKYDVVFFVTYFSPSAKPFLKNCPGLIGSTSLPWENLHTYRRAIDELKIRRLILVRYDFWPVLIDAFQTQTLPISVVCATFRKARSVLPEALQLRLRKQWFDEMDSVFLVSSAEKEILSNPNSDNEKYIIAGDAKWARAKERAAKIRAQVCSEPIQTLRQTLTTESTEHAPRVLVFGSPHREELDVLQRLLSSNLSNTLYIVAPQEVDKQTVKNLEIQLAGEKRQLLKVSEFNPQDWTERIKQHNLTTVVILDTFGYLADAYVLADLAVVGGGFDGQLHNVLEPAAIPTVTLFGNRATRAPEAQVLLTHNAAIGFANPEMLFQFLRRWGTLRTDDEIRAEMLQRLATVQTTAESLFASLPDTSEVVCRALACKDALEAN